MTPLLLLTCFLPSPQQCRVPGAWTVPCSAGSSARRGRAPVAPACPLSRRMTVGNASRSSSHPVVRAPTLQRPLLQPPALPCLQTCPGPLHSTPAPRPLASPLCGSRILVGMAALLPLTPSPGSPQLWGGFGAGGERIDPTPLLVHPPAATPATTCAAGPCQHPAVPEPGDGRVPGWLLGRSGVCPAALGWGLFTGEDMATQGPRLCRSRVVLLAHGAITRADLMAEANGCPRPYPSQG